MSETIAFFGGALLVGIIWFWNDTANNPYMRGYADGLHDGIEEVTKIVLSELESLKKEVV